MRLGKLKSNKEEGIRLWENLSPMKTLRKSKSNSGKIKLVVGSLIYSTIQIK